MDAFLSILVIVALLLWYGAYKVWRGGNRTKAMLMVVAGLVAIGNVAMWIVPTDNGATLLNDRAGVAGE